MALFTDALYGAGQAPSWPSSPDLAVYETYGETFHLQDEPIGGHQPPTFHQADYSGSLASAATTALWAQRVQHPRPGADHNPTHGFFSAPTSDWWRCLGLDGGKTEWQCSRDATQITGDSESTREGNSGEEKEWLELAGGRIAAPPSQNWDRRQRMLLPEVEARRSLAAMEEAAGPPVPAAPDVGGEDPGVAVYSGLETIAWDAGCFGDLGEQGGALGEQEPADRSKVMADDPFCMSHCPPGEGKLEMHRGKSTLPLSLLLSL